MKKLSIALAILLGVVSTGEAQRALSLTAIGTLKSGPVRAEDPRIAEINAYDAVARRIYVVNPMDGKLDVIDMTHPTAPRLADPVDIVDACRRSMGLACPVLPGSEPNSIAIDGNLLAVAVANAVRTANGHAVFFDLRRAATPHFLGAVEVGALPDMIKFSEDKRYVLTANEGEPDASYTIDPPGSVSIIDVARLGAPDAVRQVGFESFNHPTARAALQRDGVRIFGPGASVAQDLEPEYIAVSGNRAFVTLQENNGLAIIDITTASVEQIVGLGLKDHSLPGNALDASDQDNAINIRNWPVYGLYEPDSIDAFTANGHSYLIMANEGDARDYAGYTEAVRLGSNAYVLDPLVFPTASALKANTALGRLNVSTASGNLDGDNDFDRIEVPGGRSISIRDQQGRLVWDSGDSLERLSEQFDGTLTVFNTTNTANSRDNRSDDKGVEPESVVVGEVAGRLYAFVGLERDSGIVVFDLANPAAPVMVTYATNRKLPRNASTGAFLTCSDTVDCGDLGPEGLTFVPAQQSPTGTPLLIVSNEASSTTTIWRID